MPEEFEETEELPEEENGEGSEGNNDEEVHVTRAKIPRAVWEFISKPLHRMIPWKIMFLNHSDNYCQSDTSM